jgi:hypothetical protein
MAQRLIAWAPLGRETLGAVLGVKGQPLNPGTYPLLLAYRLKDLVEVAPEDDLQQASDLLMEAGLMDLPLERARAAAQITESPGVMQLLASKRIPGQGMPRTLEENDEEAMEEISETSLIQWVYELVSGRIDRT